MDVRSHERVDRRVRASRSYRGDALAFVRRLADESVGAVFTEHMVEHVTPAYLVRSLREWWRICRVGGAIRIVAPDLERTCGASRATASGRDPTCRATSPCPGRRSPSWTPSST